MLEGLVYETLLDLDPITSEDVPNLARRWAIGPDQKTFLFEIDPKAQWSDGRLVNPSDVVTTTGSSPLPTSDRIAVMNLGNLVAIPPTAELFDNPHHPYTQALLSAIPQADPTRPRARRQILQGEVPKPLNKPSGGGFRTRCPIAQPDGAQIPPPLLELGGGRSVACPHHARQD